MSLETNKSTINEQTHTRALGVTSAISLQAPQEGRLQVSDESLIQNDNVVIDKKTTEPIIIDTTKQNLTILATEDATILIRIAEPNYTTKITLHVKAKVNFITHLEKRSEHEHIQELTVDKEGELTNTTIISGEGKLFLTQQATLLENSTYNNHVLIDTPEYIDANTIADHVGAHSTSDTKVYGVINKKAIVRNLVKIQASADNANGYEKADFLMTSPQARAVSIPDLEIHNHNVSCSHGSTTSSINEEKLFYLTSRGLAKKDARELIIQGFKDNAIAHLSQEIKQLIGKSNNHREEDNE
jgi:Fe-S cluster assembly scaffold protein SufB